MRLFFAAGISDKRGKTVGLHTVLDYSESCLSLMRFEQRDFERAAQWIFATGTEQ
jgi:hypothetical protein